MNKAEVIQRAKGLPDDKRNAIVCALIGHSSIVTTCFGYVYCARCEAQVGDTLGGASDLLENVLVGHDCDMCRANYAKLGWKHKLYTPNPFTKEKA